MVVSQLKYLDTHIIRFFIYLVVNRLEYIAMQIAMCKCVKKTPCLWLHTNKNSKSKVF